MKIIKTLLIGSLFTSSLCFAEQVQELVGYWKSSKGAIYKSDGSNFICTWMPKEIRNQYSQWDNKNRLFGIKVNSENITAIQKIWMPDGTGAISPVEIIISQDTLILERTDEHPKDGKSKHQIKFTRYTKNDLEAQG